MSGPEIWSPTASPAAVDALATRLRAAAVRADRGRPLGPLTTFGIGGPAALFVEPQTPGELAAVLTALAETAGEGDLPMLVLGRGSNLLVADSGFPGLVLRLGREFARIHRDGSVVAAGGAAAMPRLAVTTARWGLAGLEFAAAIPASVGGSVRMNAGAHGAEMVDVLETVELVAPGRPRPDRIPAADLKLAYRSSQLPPRAVVTGAVFRLREDDPAAVLARLDEHRAYRRRTQPLRARSCGSTFTNPPGGNAGRLIDAAGLKGRTVGGATVSPKHANFITVSPGTRATDVLALIEEVRAAVRAAGGPDLVPEVKAVGDFTR